MFGLKHLLSVTVLSVAVSAPASAARMGIPNSHVIYGNTVTGGGNRTITLNSQPLPPAFRDPNSHSPPRGIYPPPRVWQ